MTSLTHASSLEALGAWFIDYVPTMDASTMATMAALAVAFVDFLLTIAQAIQQYVLSGQLIRVCDSVVHGEMTGQGHRIWGYSQSRFRIVYSIPKIIPLREVRNMSSPLAAHGEQEHQRTWLCRN